MEASRSTRTRQAYGSVRSQSSDADACAHPTIPLTSGRPATPGFLVRNRSTLRRAGRRGLRQQLPDRSPDVEPELPDVLVARLSGLM